MGDSIDRSRVSLDWVGEREEGVDDVGRREASLVRSEERRVGNTIDER